ncbi:hypothetical protein KJ359_002095 [Pestalotiopsis sp. 9143b]|nr:hypothetical protein KJ359_002095 [Pestalotiopsis sp. 9143b]
MHHGSLPIASNDSYPVFWRWPLTLDAPRARYPGFKQETLVLKKGTVRREGALELPCDIVFERDYPVTLRDGTVIYTDVFRPALNGKYPAIVAWSPYGKEIGGQWLDDTSGRSGVPLSSVSELQKFEGPDPAFWVNHGYVILNPDARGAYSSKGNITYWGRQLAEDGYDFIEWAAQRSWSNGKIGMSGNPWLAASQWFIAAEKPPSPPAGFQEATLTTFAGNNLVEDVSRMCINEYLITEYWEDKIAQLDKINVPAYVVASYTNTLHTHGTFEGYRRIQSPEKWLRVHNSSEWPDYYQAEHVAELKSFFDRFLKNDHDAFNSTPKFRISILDPSGGDAVDVVEEEWPVPSTTAQAYYLGLNASLSQTLPNDESETTYNASDAGGITFTYPIEDGMEINGYMKLRLWVEAVGSDDMELTVTVQKLSADGSSFTSDVGGESSGLVGASGMLRASQRALDKQRSTDSEPYLLHDREELLSEGEIVPVEIGIWPLALRVNPDELLAVTVAPSSITPTSADLGFGTAIVPVPAEDGTFAAGTNVSLIELGGNASSNPTFVDQQRAQTPESRNQGTHVIHHGGRYDSFLLVPVRPSNTTTTLAKPKYRRHALDAGSESR